MKMQCRGRAIPQRIFIVLLALGVKRNKNHYQNSERLPKALIFNRLLLAGNGSRAGFAKGHEASEPPAGASLG